MTTNQRRARHAVTAASMAAAAAAGWFVTLQITEPAAPTTAQQPTAPQAPAPEVPAAQPVAAAPAPEIQTVGQVVALSGDTLTTSAPDGQITTFRLTPETARIGQPGASVVVVGVVRDGVAVATAIADQSVAAGQGPPMDYHLPT